VKEKVWTLVNAVHLLTSRVVATAGDTIVDRFSRRANRILHYRNLP
jgi:hypothetical protein